MEILQATFDDYDGIMELHKKYHINSIAPEDKPHGFVTTNFTATQMENLINNEQGVTVAKENGVVLGYAMAASWQFWAEWPFFTYMINELPKHSFSGQPLSLYNSYQYGPICIDVSVRGSGVFEQVFYASLKSMAKKYPMMVTFINQANQRSYAAHTHKVSMATIGSFQYNLNDYHMLACHTAG